MLTGQCLCGRIGYQIAAQIKQIVFCHCENCRRATGSAFNSAAVVDADKFTLLRGEAHIKRFSSSPGVHRLFCGECGSPLYSIRDSQPHVYRLRIGTLDTPINPEEKVHIFVASKAPWETLCDDNPKHDASF
ncbi:glutathione-dependent formaldehyde-activating enzyme [Leminorella richardii]|uniref:Glutathione-dependent formaldehyde-activating enzyme n=1 Tax=Leminorella richardii TaxID=158841 RepID=A0A2X4V1G4_9GAMM|nr:GFA family protein [Leminorella richardii]SQI44469.1 glutathione-dependent formaldehyde-activating enzyme [Leminorella richardii]